MRAWRIGFGIVKCRRVERHIIRRLAATIEQLAATIRAGDPVAQGAAIAAAFISSSDRDNFHLRAHGFPPRLMTCIEAALCRDRKPALRRAVGTALDKHPYCGPC